VWCCAIIGAVLKLVLPGRFDRLSRLLSGDGLGAAHVYDPSWGAAGMAIWFVIAAAR